MVVAMLLACTAEAVDVTGSVTRNPKLEIPPHLARAADMTAGRVQMVKDGQVLAAGHVTSTGAFVITDVTNGDYLLYVTHPFFRIDPVSLKVEGNTVSASAYDTVRSDPGAALTYPLKLRPSAFQTPYVPEEEFNAFQILKNPMAIMGLVMLALVWVMPKLQGGVSADEMRDMRKSLEEDGGMAASFLKKMIPTESSGAANQALGGAIPSIAAKKQQ